MKQGNFKHISFNQRCVIYKMIVSNYKLKEIAYVLSLDPTSVSKEVKRNRNKFYSKNDGYNHYSDCKRTKRFPYVCNGCAHRYALCHYQKYAYVPKDAQRKTSDKLVLSRRGIDITSEEYKKLDKTIKEDF